MNTKKKCNKVTKIRGGSSNALIFIMAALIHLHANFYKKSFGC